MYNERLVLVTQTKYHPYHLNHFTLTLIWRDLEGHVAFEKNSHSLVHYGARKVKARVEGWCKFDLCPCGSCKLILALRLRNANIQ